VDKNKKINESTGCVFDERERDTETEKVVKTTRSHRKKKIGKAAKKERRTEGR